MQVAGEDPVEVKFKRIIIDEPTPFVDPSSSLNSKNDWGFSAYSRIYHPRSAVFLLEQPIENLTDLQIELVLRNRVFALSAFPLLIRRGNLSASGSDQFAELSTSETYRQQRAKLKQLRAERGTIKSTDVPVLAERPSHLPRQQHVFIRGLFLTKGQRVERGVPQSLSGQYSAADMDRFDMAQWIVAPTNPLTARVAANRIWSRLFGTGIVATEEDFGSSGESPSHPELLDHLAVIFQSKYKWSQKRLLREIVLSSTYRQDSSIREELLDRDPNNRLLARGPRHRLSSEMVRDQALAISGLLSEKMFGAPVHPPIPANSWNPFAGGDRWNTAKKDSANRYRRSIYTYTKRSIPFPMFAAFDSPSREFCQPRRLRSNTPVQALMMLNDLTIVECSDAFAKRMIDSDETDVGRIEQGFILSTCRKPSVDEIAVLESLLQTSSDQLTGYRAIATVLLNLDEVLTK